MNAEPYVDTTKSSLYRVPLLGRLHFVPELAGIICCSVTTLYWIYGVWCTYAVILIPHYMDGQCKIHLLVSKYKTWALSINHFTVAVQQVAGSDLIYLNFKSKTLLDSSQLNCLKMILILHIDRIHLLTYSLRSHCHSVYIIPLLRLHF